MPASVGESILERVSDAAKQYARLVLVVGPPGTGKTKRCTLWQRSMASVTSMSEFNWREPFWIFRSESVRCALGGFSKILLVTPLLSWSSTTSKFCLT